MNPVDRNLKKIEFFSDFTICFRSFVLPKKVQKRFEAKLCDQ